MRPASYDPGTMHDFDDDAPIPLGVVVEADRGSLPFALLHGEPLVACAAWAMGEAGVRLLDLRTSWDDVRDAGGPLVWHDALCPMVPPGFIRACVRRAVEAGVVVAGVLAVTDTVKEIVQTTAGPVVGETLDRDGLRRLASPIVIPPVVVAAVDAWPSTDFRSALAALRRIAEVELLEAPPEAARVTGPQDLARLEALTRP